MTGYVLNMTGFALNTTGCVLNITGFVLYMTEFVLKTTGFSIDPALRPGRFIVLQCLFACFFVCVVVPPHIFFHDGCPTLPIYLGPPIFLQIPDPL